MVVSDGKRLAVVTEHGVVHFPNPHECPIGGAVRDDHGAHHSARSVAHDDDHSLATQPADQGAGDGSDVGNNAHDHRLVALSDAPTEFDAATTDAALAMPIRGREQVPQAPLSRHDRSFRSRQRYGVASAESVNVDQRRRAERIPKAGGREARSAPRSARAAQRPSPLNEIQHIETAM